MIDGTLAALADPVRRSVVEHLSGGPRRAGELAETLHTPAPTMSRHLGVLRRAGLVEVEEIGDDARVRLYRLRPTAFAELRGWIEEVERFWTDQLAAFKAHVER